MFPVIGLAGGIGFALTFVCMYLGSWYIDDAAISLSYARNLARGIGLVAQVGDAPVEGFSNPLWVFLESLVMKVSGWYSLAVPRAITIVLLGALVIHIIVRYWRDVNRCCVWLFAVLLSVLQPSVSIWAMSGLENGLLFALAFELMIQLEDAKKCNLYVVSIIASAMALTRPDAVLFSVVAPVLILLRAGRLNGSAIGDVLKSISCVVVVYGGYLLFRFSYFGVWVPNTYYAKALPTIGSLAEIAFLGPEVRARLFDALFVVFGAATSWAVVLFCAMAFLYPSHVKSYFQKYASVLLVFCIAALGYAYLPNDWMPYCRFATVFFIGGYVMIAFATISCVKGMVRGMFVCIFILASVVNLYSGMVTFVKNFPISVDEVKTRGEYFKDWACILGVEKPLVMTADAGGILWSESVRLLDLGMLCDATIASCLGEYQVGRDNERFWDYVFEERKPDFIATRAYHSYIANLFGDPRFERDYVPVHQYIDTWILNRYGCIMYSGDYVRRDLVEGRNEILKKLQNESNAVYYPFDLNLKRIVTTEVKH